MKHDTCHFTESIYRLNVSIIKIYLNFQAKGRLDNFAFQGKIRENSVASLTRSHHGHPSPSVRVFNGNRGPGEFSRIHPWKSKMAVGVRTAVDR